MIQPVPDEEETTRVSKRSRLFDLCRSEAAPDDNGDPLTWDEPPMDADLAERLQRSAIQSLSRETRSRRRIFRMSRTGSRGA